MNALEEVEPKSVSDENTYYGRYLKGYLDATNDYEPDPPRTPKKGNGLPPMEIPYQGLYADPYNKGYREGRIALRLIKRRAAEYSNDLKSGTVVLRRKG